MKVSATFISTFTSTLSLNTEQNVVGKHGCGVRGKMSDSDLSGISDSSFSKISDSRLQLLSKT